MARLLIRAAILGPAGLGCLLAGGDVRSAPRFFGHYTGQATSRRRLTTPQASTRRRSPWPRRHRGSSGT